MQWDFKILLKNFKCPEKNGLIAAHTSVLNEMGKNFIC
jgi:hypothetical protein